MGTDIHVFTELKTPKGCWINCNPFTFNADGVLEMRYSYDLRDYDCFDFLQALEEHDLPHDLTKATTEKIEAYGGAGYGHNCFSFKELWRVWKDQELEDLLTLTNDRGVSEFVSRLYICFIENLYKYGEYQYSIPLTGSTWDLAEAEDLVERDGDRFRIIIFFDC